VEFHLAQIETLPLPDASVDCVISNCVINLSPDKPAVFREIARVLVPGGRVAVSDIVLKKPLPPEIAGDVMAYVGCIAGALSVEAYRRGLREAGFSGIEVVDSGADLNAYATADSGSCCSAPASTCCAPSDVDVAPRSCCGQASQGDEPFHDGMAALFGGRDINEYAASVHVFAVKAG
jgi:SAM-dependent methyltransferase